MTHLFFSHEYVFSGELSGIVEREMDKNKLLNDELMALKSATNVIQLIQSEASEQQVIVDKIDVNETKQTILINFCRWQTDI